MTTATTPFDLLSAEVFRRVVHYAADRVGDVRSMALTSRQWRDEVASLFPAAGMDFWLLRELLLFWRRPIHAYVADAPLARWFSRQGLATVEDLAGVAPDFHSSMAAEAGVATQMVTEVAESAIKKAVARAQQLAQGIDLLPRYVSAVQALPTLPSWRHIHEAHRRRAASTHSLFPETPRRQFSELREVYQGSATTPLHSYVFTFELLAAGNRIGSGVSRIYSAEAVGSANFSVEEDCLLDEHLSLWAPDNVPACFATADSIADLESAEIMLRVLVTDATTRGLDTLVIYEGLLDSEAMHEKGEFEFASHHPDDPIQTTVGGVRGPSVGSDIIPRRGDIGTLCNMCANLQFNTVPAPKANRDAMVISNGYDVDFLEGGPDWEGYTGWLKVRFSFHARSANEEYGRYLVVDLDSQTAYPDLESEWPHTDFTQDHALQWALAGIFEAEMPLQDPARQARGSAGTGQK